jgi:hypothetical protein
LLTGTAAEMMGRMVGGATGGDAISQEAVTQRRLRHDLREQATVISWAAAQLLEDGESSPRRVALLNAVADAAAELVRLADERMT